ncbi:hypothetical protein BO83DRAFT_77388 [Aspergillus eucalypticola CBS 122712]|uniref:Secreted protein n=1 Tax=Aspergillus eucalypticola (strain CBS 122712 / IBT 29274) TaxID=1448314 RepID=A0A317WIA2_ASPEC|nr:uncharacterized protein BO83DRAFT_77388 [Aspergillus eucalypticola CBS 122712]PWY83940.1 hypothetical protein BO83DRAFT_77388 [Aspergillus eucalypticola CBS 122712]
MSLNKVHSCLSCCAALPCFVLFLFHQHPCKTRPTVISYGSFSLEGEWREFCRGGFPNRAIPALLVLHCPPLASRLFPFLCQTTPNKWRDSGLAIG